MCSEKLIGLKDCLLEEPITGLYIDELGISNTFLANLITDQYVSGKDLFAERRNLAWRKVSTDVLKSLSGNMKSDTLIEGRRIGQRSTNQTSYPALGAGNYTGIKLRITPNETSFIKIFVSELLIESDSPSDILIYFFNLNTGELLQTLNYSELNTDQYIAFSYSGKRRDVDIAIVYESLYTVPKYTVTGNSSCSSCGGGVKEAFSSPYARASGIKLTLNPLTGKVASVSNATHTYGMSISYNVSCDREQWLCSIGGLMALPLAYATAIEIYDYALTFSPNQRVNTTVGINNGLNNESNSGILRAREIAVSRYTDEMNSLLGNIRLPNDAKCWDCRRNLIYATVLP
jgi:hypothetical protein